MQQQQIEWRRVKVMEMLSKGESNQSEIARILQVDRSGYLVYTFFVVDAQDQTGHLIIVDAGNPEVLYISQGQPMGSFSLQLLLMARI